MGDGDGVEVRRRHAGVGERLVDDRQDPLGVRAARDLGHDAAPSPVELDLRVDHVAAHAVPVLDDRRGGLVAAGFDAEDELAHAVSMAAGAAVIQPSARRPAQLLQGGLELRVVRGARRRRHVEAVSRGQPRERGGVAIGHGGLVQAAVEPAVGRFVDRGRDVGRDAAVLRVSGGEASPSISKVLEAAAIAGVDDIVSGIEQARINSGGAR